ncbi:hypothetical protein N7495_005487 [Penicillium taxi]|uniref:uncharacterized protein n=1 Tax=Penicillium taxi TaxID=168475 RepID=UPI00254503A6|nr:uncharacterized protein N7495_005487 [Penicillium taxi]KAJ5893796.1 hypothetical protein N7495_005487 [Penicillium taxi]
MARIKTRICMISDTHSNSPTHEYQTNNPYRVPLPKANILLHAGDLTKVGYLSEHEETVSMLKVADAELKIVIAGNHDISLDEEYFTTFGYRRHRKPIRLGLSDLLPDTEEDKPLMTKIDGNIVPHEENIKDYVRRAKDLYTNQAARDAGIRYLEEGVHTFTLSTGAKFTVYSSPYQPEFCRWAFGYPRSEDRYNPPLPGITNRNPHPANPVPDFPCIDIMLTHGPPSGILDNVSRTDNPENVGCKHLLRAAERARPRLYLFGHIHEQWGGIRGTWNSFASGGIQQEVIPTNKSEMLEKRGAFYDVSSSSARPLRVGEETLFVNASICQLSYRAENAPWVVDLDLPLTGETE